MCGKISKTDSYCIDTWERPLEELTFTAIDLETTGFAPSSGDRIIEIGMKRFTIQGGAEEYTTLIDPGVAIPVDATKVNGITDEMVRGKPTMCELSPTILQFLDSTIPIAHNFGFDYSFLAKELERNGLDYRPVVYVDTVHLAKRRLPGCSSYKLQNLATTQKLERSGTAHRAMADALLCWRLFMRCLEPIENPASFKLQNLLNKSISPE